MSQKVTTYSCQTSEYQQILSFLYSMKRTDTNHSLLREYFLNSFSLNTENLHHFIDFLSRHLQNTDNLMREKLARRYVHIFSFLCERFGLYEDKLKLDDICFEITHPREYKKLKAKLEKYQKTSESIIDDIFTSFNQVLATTEVKYKLKGRYKNIYSVYNKILKKKTWNLLDLGDIFAFRIIIDGTESDCYDILGILHNNFYPLPSRFKDYIQIPKINGYQSIHSGLLGVIQSLEIPIEVQIRTHDMDIVAESGIAAHYIYAKDKKSQRLGEKEQKLLHHIDGISQNQNKNTFVYCLTPEGDIKKLNSGSTVKDFASKIHSKLSDRVRQAQVNNTLQKMNYKIKNFDSIQLITH